MTVEEGAGRWTGIEVPHVPADGSERSGAPKSDPADSSGLTLEGDTPADGRSPGVSTGSFMADEPIEGGRRRLLVAQTAVVAGSALLVGLGVFAVIGALAGGGSSEQATPDDEDAAIVDPGPEDGAEPDGSTDNSSRSGTRIDTDDESTPSGDGIGEDVEANGSVSDGTPTPAEDQDLNAAAGDLADPADPAGSEAADPEPDEPVTGGPVSSPEVLTPPPGATPGTPIPVTIAPSSVDGAPGPTIGPPTTVQNSTLTSNDSTPGGDSTVPSTTPSGSPASPSTTQAPVTTTTLPSTSQSITTPSQPTTTLPSTTTSQSTTTLATTTLPSVTLPLSLVRNPIDGSRHDWGQPTQFQAEDVGAAQYCWTFLSGAGSDQRCSSSPSYLLPARSANVAPGPVTATASAIGLDGATIAQQQISISLIAQNVLNAPIVGEEIYIGNPLVVEFADIPTADEYCVTVSQGSLQRPRCGATKSQVYLTAILLLSGFEPGPVSVSATVNRNGVQLGRESVTITLR